MRTSFSLSVVLLVLALSSCKPVYQLTDKNISSVAIAGDSKLYDSTIASIIQPYKQRVDEEMNKVIGKTTVQLRKGKPESTLGILMCDASVWYAQKHYDKPIDLAFMNDGGIRIPSLGPGSLTVGNIFELMPFENQLVVLELKGNVIQEWTEYIAQAGGEPVAGMRMTISDKKPKDVTIGGMPIDPTRTYTMVTSDYIANGGGNAAMLKRFEKSTNLNYLLRQAIIDYITEKKELNITTDGRITKQ